MHLKFALDFHVIFYVCLKKYIYRISRFVHPCFISSLQLNEEKKEDSTASYMQEKQNPCEVSYTMQVLQANRVCLVLCTASIKLKKLGNNFPEKRLEHTNYSRFSKTSFKRQWKKHKYQTYKRTKQCINDFRLKNYSASKMFIARRHCARTRACKSTLRRRNI